jgi:DNA polymerase-3 subunit epsilon
MEMLGLDTETTGLSVENDRFVEVALIERTHYENVDNNGRIIQMTQDDIDCWIINPGVLIPRVVVGLHGIDNVKAKSEGVAPKESVERIVDAIVGAVERNRKIVVFNASYDLKMLHFECRRHGVDTVEERLGRELLELVDPLCLDRALYPDRKGRRNLAALADVYEVGFLEGSLHRADVDTSLMLDILEEQLRLHPELVELSAEELFEFQKKGRWRR